MKRLIILCIVALALVLTPATALADKEPELKSISFKNAVIDGGFDSEKQEYTITLEDNTASPTLEKYEIDGEANIFINYKFNESNHSTGLTATIQYPTGSKIYDFTYSNPASYVKNSDNSLSAIIIPYGELSPELDEETSDYTLYIPCDLTKINISPVTSDLHAHCAAFDFELKDDQLPTITLLCTASDGSERTYNLTVKRVDKTTQEVELEMNDPDYVSFVRGTRPFEKPEFLIACGSAVLGIIIIAVLIKVTRKMATNPYDPDEKPFYKS